MRVTHSLYSLSHDEQCTRHWGLRVSSGSLCSWPGLRCGAWYFGKCWKKDGLYEKDIVSSSDLRNTVRRRNPQSRPALRCARLGLCARGRPAAAPPRRGSRRRRPACGPRPRRRPGGPPRPGRVCGRRSDRGARSSEGTAVRIGRQRNRTETGTRRTRPAPRPQSRCHNVCIAPCTEKLGRLQQYTPHRTWRCTIAEKPNFPARIGRRSSQTAQPTASVPHASACIRSNRTI
mmetsp:Transcript_172196/g.551988  ORF Transcript_172196/g.551988 Transcript_172196/m.551988 type:complete len:232 (-) Transcript_172196:189-884(-)